MDTIIDVRDYTLRNGNTARIAQNAEYLHCIDYEIYAPDGTLRSKGTMSKSNARDVLHIKDI